MKQCFTLVFLLFLLITPGCSWFCQSHESVQKQKGSTVVLISSMAAFDKYIARATKPIVVHFASKWCSNCQKLEPIFKTVAQELQDRYLFAIVSVDKAENLAQKCKVTEVPVIAFFKEGKELEKRLLQKQYTIDELIDVIEDAFLLNQEENQ